MRNLRRLPLVGSRLENNPRRAEAACASAARRTVAAGQRSCQTVFASASLLPMMLLLAVAGCRTYGETGALVGGGTGAATGAVIGHQLGNTAGGAVLGAAVGTLAGSLMGDGLDQVEAKNRAMIASQMGRPVPAGAVGPGEVIQLSQAGVAEELIINHIRGNGVRGPVTGPDLIAMQGAGVSPRVVQELQRPQGPPAMVAVPPPGPVYVDPYYPPPGYYGPPPYYYAPRVSIGYRSR